MGLFQKFTEANIFVNDCDEDVCLSWSLFQRPEFALSTTNPLVNKLISVEDMLDCTSGMYPLYKDSKFLKEISWIFQPYRRFRKSSEFAKRDSSFFQYIIESVTDRIYLYFVGQARQNELDTRFYIVDKIENFHVIEEIGDQARLGLFSDGIQAFISIGKNGKYTIGKNSIFIEPDFNLLINKLNESEQNENDKWGGGNTIIGSPRNEGSKLTINDICNVIKECL